MESAGWSALDCDSRYAYARCRKKRERWLGSLLDELCAVLWLVALGVLGAGLVVEASRALGPGVSAAPMVREVIVGKGDCIWTFAVRYGGGKQDVRAVARQIRCWNGLAPGEVVHPGTRLLVPDYTHGSAKVACTDVGDAWQIRGCASMDLPEYRFQDRFVRKTRPRNPKVGPGGCQ